jgi:hypothetical protein
MKMICCMVLIVSMFATVARSDTGTYDPDPLLTRLDKMTAEAKAGKAAEYAPDALKEALSGIASAQAAVVAGGNQKLAEQKIEMASLLVTFAEAKAAERELLEKVAVQRVEIKKLEAQLERYLQGEEK